MNYLSAVGMVVRGAPFGDFLLVAVSTDIDDLCASAAVYAIEVVNRKAGSLLLKYEFGSAIIHLS